MKIPAWLSAVASILACVLLVIGAVRVEAFIVRTTAEIRSLVESQTPAAPMRLIFEWKTGAGTQRLETPRERGETFSQLWQRHQLYIRLALED